MNAWQEAVQRFQNAVNELEKRVAAQEVGAAIGAAVGEALYINKRTPEQIDAMSVPDMEAWVSQVVLNPPSSPPEG